MTLRLGSRIFANTVVWGYALVILGPTLWVLSNAFKFKIDIITGATVSPFTWINFHELLFSRQSDFLTNLLNSAVIGIASTAIVIVV
ncbi:MAG: carbohydrate ABC transporter permease, partial [Hyphomicrobiaceae bacterium]